MLCLSLRPTQPVLPTELEHIALCLNTRQAVGVCVGADLCEKCFLKHQSPTQVWDVHPGTSSLGWDWLRELRRVLPSLLCLTLGCEVIGWVGWLVYMSASLLHVGVTEFFWEKACVTWQRLPWCQIFTRREVLPWDPPVILLLVNTHCESREEAEQRNVLFWNWSIINAIAFLSLHSMNRDLLRAYPVLGARDTMVTISALLELMVLVRLWRCAIA